MVLVSALAALGQDPRDPDGLVRLVESSPGCDFNALWDALGLNQPWEFGRVGPQHATRPCRISRVFEEDASNAPQRILALFDPDARRAYYLRYVRRNAWRFEGAQMVESKNHPHRHEVVRAGDRLYLRVSTQGASGSDIDSELEQWFDLARPAFQPVLTLPVTGHELRYGFGISRKVRTTIRPSAADGRLLIAEVEVKLYLHDRAIGDLAYRASYAPDTLGAMRLAEMPGPGSSKEFESFTQIREDGPSNEALLPYAFSGLRALALEAREKNPYLAEALRFFLSQMKSELPQVQELKAILGPPVQNPVDFQAWIDSQRVCDIGVLWRFLGVKLEGRESDFRKCTARMVLDEPRQAIMVLNVEDSPEATYVRWVKPASGTWQLSGVQSAHSHNHPHRAEVDKRMPSRPFLRIATQGVYGSGVDSEDERWYDLTRPDFEPVLSVPVSGHQDRVAWGISRKLRVSIHSASNGLIAIARVDLDFDGAPLGVRSYQAIYMPDSAGRMTLRAVTGSGPLSEYESMLDLDRGPSNETLIRLAMPGLRTLSRNGTPEQRRRLGVMLELIRSETPEVRELKAILR